MLDPVINQTGTSSETCGITTIKMQYKSETGQVKICGCISNKFCSSTVVCSKVIQLFQPGAESLECKVLYINIYFPSFCFFSLYEFF